MALIRCGGSKAVNYKSLGMGEGAQNTTFSITAADSSDSWLLVCKVTTTLSSYLTLTVNSEAVDVDNVATLLDSGSSQAVYLMNTPINNGDTVSYRFTNGGGSYVYMLSA